jgi:hypothetical protein
MTRIVLIPTRTADGRHLVLVPLRSGCGASPII